MFGYSSVEPAASTVLERSHREPRFLELLPVELCRLTLAGPDDRAPGVVDLVRHPVPVVDRQARDHTRKRGGDVVERVVVVVENDDPPGPVGSGAWPAGARLLDRLRRHPCYFARWRQRSLNPSGMPPPPSPSSGVGRA